MLTFKKLLFFAFIYILTITSLPAQEQEREFKKFKFGLGLGIGKAAGGSSGIVVYLEPAWRITDKIATGVRWNLALLARGLNGQESVSAEANSSIGFNGQYYFGNSRLFRPFSGIGIGLFTIASTNIAVNGISFAIQTDNKFGFYPRVGFDFGHLNIIFDYNIIPASNAVEISLTNFTASTKKIKNNYYSIKVGISIGGGGKKKSK